MANKQFIDRKLTLKEQIEEKSNHLQIKGISKQEVDGKDLLIYEYKNGLYRSFIKLNLTISPSLLTESDTYMLISQFQQIIRQNQHIRLYCVKTPPNFGDLNLGLTELVRDTEQKEFLYKQLEKEYADCSLVMDYYLDINYDSLYKLMEQINYLYDLTSSEDKKKNFLFELRIPSKSENDYIYDNLVLGGLNVKYHPDYIEYDTGSDTKEYVKYLVVEKIKPEQRLYYWKGLTFPINADLLIDINFIPEHKLDGIIDKLNNALDEKQNKSSANNARQKQQRAILSPIIESLLMKTDSLVDVKFVIKFKGDNLAELNKQIKTFKKDNNNFIFSEKLDIYMELEKFWLGKQKNNSIPNNSLTLNLFAKGFGLFFSNYVQDGGILMCNKRNTITIVNRNVVRQEDGQLNFSEFICGSTGSGKSVTMKKLMLYSLLSKQDKVIVLDVQSEYLKLCKMFNGQIVDVSNINSGIKLNPFDIIVNENGTIEYKKVVEFLGLLSSSIRDNNDFRTQIENYLINICPEFDGTITLSSFYNKLLEKIENEELESPQDAYKLKVNLENIITTYPMFDGITNVDFDNRFIVFNMLNIKSDNDLKLAINYIILRLVNTAMYTNKFIYKDNDGNSLNELQALLNYADSKMIDLSEYDNKLNNLDEYDDNDLQKLIGEIKSTMEVKHPKVRLIIDEAQNILNDLTIVQFLLSLVSEGRKFNIGIMLATQSPAELLSGSTEELKEIKRQLWEKIPYKYFLKISDLSGLNLVIKTSGNEETSKPLFSPSQIDFLQYRAKKGEGFLMYNAKNYLIGVNASKDLINFFDGGIG